SSSQKSDARTQRLVQVAVPVPTLDLLTYAVPDGVRTPPIGARVIVPLRSRVVTPLVVGNEDHRTKKQRNTNPNPRPRNPDPQRPTTDPDRHSANRRREVLDAPAFIPKEVGEPAQWPAESYAAGVGATIPLLLPPMARGGRADAHKTVRVAAVTPAGLEA